MDSKEFVGRTKSFSKTWMGRLLWVLLSLIALALVLLIVFRLLFVDFVDNYELGYKFDRRTGKIERLHKTGYVVTPPILVNIHTIDLRPMQVCINANQRVLNCKLVRFNPEGMEIFVSWHGRQDYDAVGNLNDILKSYAYEGSGKSYPFLTVTRELKNYENETPIAAVEKTQ